jgi:hypothetical protein
VAASEVIRPLAIQFQGFSLESWQRSPQFFSPTDGVSTQFLRSLFGRSQVKTQIVMALLLTTNRNFTEIKIKLARQFSQ